MNAEILAPVGGQEQLIAAVRCGADAVYLGAKGFNARRNAENFDEESLSQTVAYCHARGVKVHVTVNTLVMDAELDDLERTAEEIAASGADAVIVQDPAVMRLFLHRYPTLEVHASTQCAVHNRDGVLFYEDLGVKRVVLARELSIREIEKIRDATTVELEAFIHGALCMCLSGACTLSSMIGGRSGNRGLCAQPCRLDFRNGKRGYALSLKDMSHLKHIPELREAGVTSFKIEGRMKRPEYVAAAVTAAKKALRGESYDEDTLRAVFSRSGFTDGYAVGKRSQEMFGHRVKEDVVSVDRVLNQLQRLYDKENPIVPTAMHLEISSASSKLTMSALDTTITVSGAGGIVAKRRGTDEELAVRSLGRLGGTPYRLDGLQVTNPHDLMLAPSFMNTMRRDAVALLMAETGKIIPHRREPFLFSPLPSTMEQANALWARFRKAEQWVEDFARVILPIDELLAHPGLIDDSVIGEVPAIAFPDQEENVAKCCMALKEKGLQALWTENIYGLKLGQTLGLPVYGGAGLNILNSQSLDFYREQGLRAATISFELSMHRQANLTGELPHGYIVYGKLPLMRFRACPIQGDKGCGNCPGYGILTDRIGNTFPVLCHQRQYGTLLNCVPLHLGNRPQVDADFKLLYFTNESPEEVSQATAEIRNSTEPTTPRTGGLYYRQLS